MHDIATAEWAVAAVLAMQKYLPFYAGMQPHGEWSDRLQAREIYRLSHGEEENPPALVDEIADYTVPSSVTDPSDRRSNRAWLPSALSFCASRVAHGRASNQPKKLDDLLGQADIVILIIPLTLETKHLMDAKRLENEARSSLVNAARGAVVGTEALLSSPQRKKDSSRHRRNRSRAPALRTPAVERSQLAHHTTCGRRQREIHEAHVQDGECAG